MILHEICGQREDHPAYQRLHATNLRRQLGFLEGLVDAAIQMDRCFLSVTVINALNHHAIACLHDYAGRFRPHDVSVYGLEIAPDGRPGGPTVAYAAPSFTRVPALMEDMVHMVNRAWDRTDPAVLAAYVLWRINWIHPFVNGNGRTARAASYFTLCARLGAWLPGQVLVPELLERNRPEYVDAIRHADANFLSEGAPYLAPLSSLINRLLGEQLSSIL